MSKATEYCVEVFDGTHESPKPCERGYKLLTSKNIMNGYLDKTDAYFISEEDYTAINQRSLIRKWDILFSMIGTVGNICLITDDNIDFAIKNMGVFSCRDEYKAKWLYFYLKSPYVKSLIQNYLNGAVQKFLPLGKLRDFDIPDFDDEKRKIVNLLWGIEEKINNNKKINNKLENMAKDIYDYWFLQFEFPNEDGKPYKSSGGNMVWNEELMREIPKEWSIGTIAQFIQCDKGGDWGKDVREGNYVKNVSCLRGADFPAINGSAKLEAPERYILKKNDYKILEEGNLIIEISGGSPTQSTGRICYINHNVLRRFNKDVITSNFCKAISLCDKELMYWFYIMWCKLYDSNVLFKYEGKTTGIKNLLFDLFCKDYKIVVPDKRILKKYNHNVKTLFETIQKNQLENQQLSSLRDFLLPLLMNGQVRFQEE